MNAALSSITAAVVGVILNLSVWFALHLWFRVLIPVHTLGLLFQAPDVASVQPWAIVLSIAAMVAVFRFKAGLLRTLAGCSLAGIVLHVAGATA